MRTIGYYEPHPISDATALTDLDLPRPVPTGRDILVEIKAIAVNPVDTKVRKSRPAQNGQPVVLGYDAAGIVAEVGPDVTGYAVGDGQYAIDGCSIPAYAFPLRAVAHGFARAATGSNLPHERAKAARRLMDACIAHPWHTAGTDRFCVRAMEAGDGAIYAKTGADGFYAAALPEKGLGIALKCDDGFTPAAEMMLASVLLRLLGDDDAMRARLEPLTRKVSTNWNGIEVGEARAVPISA